MREAITLGFFKKYKLFITDICAKFGIPNSLQSPDIEKNADRGISDFRISGQSFINENYHNSRFENLTFSLKVTFYLTKPGNRTKKSLTVLILLLWVAVLFFPKNAIPSP